MTIRRRLLLPVLLAALAPATRLLRFPDLHGDTVVFTYGGDPDVVVDNDVQAVLQGRDPQLEKGIEILLQQMREDPRPLPTAPPPPVKTGR